MQRPDADEDSFMRLTRTRTNKTQVGHIERISCVLYVSLLWSVPPCQRFVPWIRPRPKAFLQYIYRFLFSCPEACLNVDFKHRDDVSELK